MKYKNQPENNSVTSPSHYRGIDGLEVKQIINEFNLDFWRGNVVKYTCRARLKKDFIEDMAKAKQNCTYAIEQYKEYFIQNRPPKERVFIICPVMQATDGQREQLESYVKDLEEDGYLVHYPARDTDQTEDTLAICKKNFRAILLADQVHIFYAKNTIGSYIDIGVLVSLLESGQEIKVINKQDIGPIVQNGTVEQLITQLERETRKEVKD